MTIALTGFNLDSLSFSVCANQLVAWENLAIGTFGYDLNTNYPNASTVNPNTLIPVGTLNWNTQDFTTSAISVTANSDTTTTILCAYNSSNPTISAIYNFNPYFLTLYQTRLSDNSVSITAKYQQLSTGLLKPISGDVILDWYTTPYTTNLTAVSSTNHNFSTHLNDTAYVLSTLLLSSDSIGYNSFVLNLSSPSVYTACNNNIIINGPITTNVISVSTDYIKLSATHYNLPLNDNTQLIWNVVPYTSAENITANGANNLTFNTQYSAISADWVTISTSNLTQSYTYTLSSYTGVASGVFRPYSNLLQTTTLSTTVSTIDDNVQTHQYYLDVHGVTNNVVHNLPANTVLLWSNTTNNNGLVANKLNGGVYGFNTFDTANNIEKLNLYITPNVTTNYPRLCTYGFLVSALTGSNITDAITCSTFNIQMQEWLDSSLFNPVFTMQYEPVTQNTIYRPCTSALYRFSSTSILPPSSVGNLIYKFDDGDVTVGYNTVTGAPSDIYHTFNALTPVACTVNLTVETSATGYSAYVTRDAIGKTIHFVDFPVASSFIMYPEFEWTGTQWGTVVETNGTILSANAPLSAYSLCHTENFFVSSNDNKATQYVWNVQNSLDNTVQTTTTLTSPTGWLPIKTPAGTTTHSVCASLFNTNLPQTMPVVYYDTPNGELYPNFSTTFQNSTPHRKHINFYGVSGSGLIPTILKVDTNPVGSPSNVYLTGGYTFNGNLENNTPFDYYMGAYTFLLSSNYFETQKQATVLNTIATTRALINSDDVGNGYLSLPKYDVNTVDIIPIIGVTPSLKVSHPSATDWCFNNTTLSSYDNKQSITVYPVSPLIYTANRYVLTGTDVKFENLVNCFSGIQDFIWNDRGIETTENTCTAYVTSYDLVGAQDITLTTHFSSHEGVIELITDFKNVVNVDANYASYNENINRVYSVTQLELPHDYEDVSMGSNDWLTADTFNACMTKLYNNLDYLQYMSQLYDVPPTEYYGWLGSMEYSNNSKHFRWFVNSPNITYGYNRPDLAVDDTFDTLKDVYVKNNIMYVSNGTSVKILSSDFRATELGSINYKTIGDTFTNIKSIKLDSDNRIYLLDTVDENNITNGSKNRVIVFTWDINTNTWTYLFSWGGLGGAKSKTSFNNPNDIYIDSLNNVWVSDTGNKVIKQYTRTGSWLQTISSDLFTNDPPLSVVLDASGNVHALTTSKVIQFSNSGVYISTKILNNAGTKTIRPCADTGFAYICYSDKIVKYMYTDGTEAVFATNDFVNYTKNYQNVFHDEFRNLYIVSPNHVLKYIDKLFIVSLKQDTTNKLWTLADIFVDKNEYLQDWVVNRGLNRMWDNIEIIRKSLLGKFAYRTIQSVTTVTTLSTLQTPSTEDFDYCNYDWIYGNGKYVTGDVIFEYLKPDVRTFTTDEYKILPFTKDQIYVGINELVSAPTLNRPLKKLYECEQTILEMIS